MGSSAESKRPLCFGCRGVCAFLSVALGVLFVLLGIWATHLQQRFTPIYTEIVCHQAPAKLEDFSAESGLHVDLITTTTCHNPNPYSVVIRSTTAERVYMGSDRTLVASVTDIPPATLPAKGSGSIRAKLRIKPTGDMFDSLLSALSGATTPIYIESSMEVVIDINFLFGRFKKVKEVNKKCGMNLQVALFAGGAEVGPMACADSFDGLTLPPVDHLVNGEIRIAAVGMAKDELDKAAKAKKVGLATAMGVGYGLGLVLLLCGSCGLWWLCRQQSAIGSAREVGNLAKHSAGAEQAYANTTCEMAATKIGAPRRNAPEEV